MDIIDIFSCGVITCSKYRKTFYQITVIYFQIEIHSLICYQIYLYSITGLVRTRLKTYTRLINPGVRQFCTETFLYKRGDTQF